MTAIGSAGSWSSRSIAAICYWRTPACPNPSSLAPARARDLARSFVSQAKTILYVQGDTDPTRTRAVHAVLRSTFEQLAQAYGRTTASAVRDWLVAYFADHEQHTNWWLWSILLPTLAGVYGPPPRAASPFEDAATKRIRQIVRAHFNREAREQAEVLERQARATPLSSLERELVALDAAVAGGVSEVDVVLSAALAIKYERARRTFRELEGKFDPTFSDLLLQWARAEAAFGGMPTAQIKMPSD